MDSAAAAAELAGAGPCGQLPHAAEIFACADALSWGGCGGSHAGVQVFPRADAGQYLGAADF